MFDFGADLRKKFENANVVDVESPGWKLPYRVTFVAYPTGAIDLLKIEAFLEAFQIYKELSLNDLMENPEEYEQFKDQVSDWWIGEQHARLNRTHAKKKEYNNDDGPEAA